MFSATCRDFCEDIEDEREGGEVHADPLSAEPLPQVLRHRVHARGHVDGDKDPAQEEDEKHRLQMRKGDMSSRHERHFWPPLITLGKQFRHAALLQ